MDVLGCKEKNNEIDPGLGLREKPKMRIIIIRDFVLPYFWRDQYNPNSWHYFPFFSREFYRFSF